MKDRFRGHEYQKVLEESADHLNKINQAAEHEEVFYDVMSGALVWRDETTNQTPIKACHALRFVVAYRTSLMLDQLRTDLKPIWDCALELFPDWVGFRAERRKATPKLLEIYRRGEVTLSRCIRQHECNLDDASEP